MSTPVTGIKARYESIDFSKIKNAAIIKELKELAQRTEAFSDIDLIEIEAENFHLLEAYMEKNFPEALGIKSTVPKKNSSKPAAKKPAPKKPAFKKAPVAKVSKDRPAKPSKKQKTLEELRAEDKYFEDCKLAIRDRNNQKKLAKLNEYKEKRITTLREKVDLTDSELEEKIAQVQAMSYQDAFSIKKSVTARVTDHVFSMFEEVVKTNANLAAANDELKGEDKSHRFKGIVRKELAYYVDTLLPRLHVSLTGSKANSYIEDFMQKGSRLIDEVVAKLDKKFAKKEVKAAA
ncbi:hypothetical protein Q0590_24815 [Rhodocytophaga aerolata]|uniref:Uncharacterized protein n=1 Tax=Rhodocytophaga aerolata TaxID=455078 RepID=A0ABT8RBN7_9BACT|nr:hypothetical protein [Rhodocytophaga aerolata]MDO1449522.1 hypothetical protein [Rhodocytophaga aerolata]